MALPEIVGGDELAGLPLSVATTDVAALVAWVVPPFELAGTRDRRRFPMSATTIVYDCLSAPLMVVHVLSDESSPPAGSQRSHWYLKVRPTPGLVQAPFEVSHGSSDEGDTADGRVGGVRRPGAPAGGGADGEDGCRDADERECLLGGDVSLNGGVGMEAPDLGGVAERSHIGRVGVPPGGRGAPREAGSAERDLDEPVAGDAARARGSPWRNAFTKNCTAYAGRSSGKSFSGVTVTCSHPSCPVG